MKRHDRNCVGGPEQTREGPAPSGAAPENPPLGNGAGPATNPSLFLRARRMPLIASKALNRRIFTHVSELHEEGGHRAGSLGGEKEKVGGPEGHRRAEPRQDRFRGLCAAAGPGLVHRESRNGGAWLSFLVSWQQNQHLPSLVFPTKSNTTDTQLPIR